ncbi:hypothetical protein OCU04_001957 [Sclerotinia nivalis]|uniref:Uncharacterized protein n=1 Tax=Sclerotinia nivalis TaxID=352851 RepID=A0A9X0AZ68_9HELO|nr:hypothetical protein OCU04_001957 [Sclerotinia nivalis]
MNQIIFIFSISRVSTWYPVFRENIFSPRITLRHPTSFGKNIPSTIYVASNMHPWRVDEFQRVLTKASRPYLSLSPENLTLAKFGYEQPVSYIFLWLVLNLQHVRSHVVVDWSGVVSYDDFDKIMLQYSSYHFLSHHVTI